MSVLKSATRAICDSNSNTISNSNNSNDSNNSNNSNSITSIKQILTIVILGLFSRRCYGQLS